MVNYLLDYPFDIYYVGLNHDPHLIAELIAASLSLILALKKFWPEKVKKFYTLCWFSLIIWCLPLREVITFLGDAYPNYMIVVDIMLLIFVLVLIMDWLSFVIVWVTGISLGLLIYYFSNEPIMVHLADYKIPFFTFGWTILTGILFSRNASRYHKNLLLQRKLAATRTVASMAHELRNPLATIRMSTRGIKRYNDILMENYYAAQAANLGTPQLPDIELMERVFKNVEAEINFSNTMIDTLLANSKEIATQSSTGSSNQIAQCVQAAIGRYPFASDEERKLIQVDLAHDFAFQGDDLMVTHVIFNLLKNALHVIKEQQKGHIFISLELANDGKYNSLHFKDTAKGMSEKTRAKIFDSFYTETQTGTGVGLAFCTMIMKGLHGKIEVKSELGVFTEFVLSFPKS